VPSEQSRQDASADTQPEKTTAPPKQPGAHAPSPQEPGFCGNLIRWLGKFHPMAVPFPIALLLVASLAEVIWVVSEEPCFRFTARFLLLLGAAGAVASAVLGWFLAGFQWTDETWVRTIHRWLGTGTALWSVGTVVLSEASERHNSLALERTFWATLFCGAALVATTGFFGGSIVYGLDHYQWPTAATDADQKKTTGATEAEAAAVVRMTDELEFVPEKCTIRTGDTVLWKAVGTYTHTVTADPDQAIDAEHVRLPEGASTFDSGRLRPGETFSHTFKVPGLYRYFCIPHELAGMIGEVEVKADKQ